MTEGSAGLAGTSRPATPEERQRRRAATSWFLFDWANQPFFALIVTFLYGPYFAGTLASTPVEGQALWGYAGATGGLIVALTAPVLGAFADRSHRRKRWLAGFSVVFIAGLIGLGAAVPSAANAVTIALVCYVIAIVGAELAIVFTNAMMPDLARPGQLGRLSGTGAAIGYSGGLVSLILVLVFVEASPSTGLTRLGFPPLFGLIPAEASTAVIGPLSAVWFVLFVWPLFLFVPDGRPATKHPDDDEAGALKAGFADLSRTVGFVLKAPLIWRFLAASMIYRDGLTALATFGGIYAVGKLSWSQTELGLFGILIIIMSVIGALVGGRFDDRIGPAFVIRCALVGLIVTTALVVSIDADTVLFVIDVAPAGPGLFDGTADLAMLGAGMLIGLFFGPVHANSRSMLVRISPIDRMTSLFGLFALAGKLTSFLGPLAVAIMTDAFDSQRAGAAIIPLFFIIGIILLPAFPRPAGASAR